MDERFVTCLKKGKDYTSTDKDYIINKQYSILCQIIPLYKRLLKDKRIEVSLTPYAHPIMPLLYDTDITKEFSYLKVPRLRFSHPQDCQWHLRKGQEVFNRAFDRSAMGSWPSEGSVSEPVAKLYNEEGFNWIGTDESILFRSLSTESVPYDLIKNQRHIIYRPYNFGGVNIFFRDRNLADALSFTYQGWQDPTFAANDLLEHFKRTHYYASNLLKQRAITIIMDGENAWEYYKNNGIDFLETVYGALEGNSILSSTTPTEFLAKSKAKQLERLCPGSWINSDFGVWVGSRENNRNWCTLRRLRDLIRKCSASERIRDKALNYFYIIEGSDWNWWNTFEDVIGDFSKIFLSFVRRIYKVLGKKPPSYII